MSDKFELVKSFYDKGLWSAARVQNAVEKKWITQEECDQVLAIIQPKVKAALEALDLGELAQ
ncbi:MAG: XkdX family protein [Segatella copri]